MKNYLFISIFILLPFLLTSCTTSSDQNLALKTHISVASSGETVMTMEVRNEGMETFRRFRRFEGQMQVRDEDGRVVVCREAPQLVGPLEPGESHFAVGWRGILPAGNYELTWRAPNYESLISNFSIIRRNGRPDLDNESLVRQTLENFYPIENCEDYPGHTLPENTSQDPPPAFLTINGQEQVSGIGTYCWTQVGEDVGICADAVGIPTAKNPMVTTSPLTMDFTFVLQQPPNFLQLNLTDAAQAEELEFKAREMR